MIMKLPKAKAAPERNKLPIIVVRGLNRQSLIADDEISSCQNLSYKNKPILSCRPPRETLYTLSSPQALFSVGTNLAWVDETNFKWNNVTKGTVTAGSKSMVDFNGKVLIFPDKKYYDYGTDTFGNIGSGTYPTAGSCPDIDFACEHMNRVFGCKGSTIYATALGKYNDWTTFAGESTDAWAKDVSSEGGDFKGIISFQNHPIIFKYDSMIELYNNKPPFSTQPVNKIGCISNKAMVEINSVFYFCGKMGIYAYGGGTPRLISDNLNETYSDAVLGTDGRYLFASLYNGSAWKLYVYDTPTPTSAGTWLQEDTLQAVQFTTINKICYALASTGALLKFNSGSESGIAWNFETKEFTYEIFNQKGIGQIGIRIDLMANSTLSVYIKYDNGSYLQVKNGFTTTGLRSLFIPLKMQMCDHFKIKLSGTGDFKFYGLQLDTEIGSEA